MAFWLAVLGGALFAWFAASVGFYQAWTTFLNVVIAVYLGVFLTPVVTGGIPAAGATSFGLVLTLAATTIGAFAVLAALSYTLLPGRDAVAFPKVFDVVGAGVVGFLSGFLVLSLVAMMVCLTPLRDRPWVRNLGLDVKSQQANLAYVGWWCERVNSLVGSSDHGLSGEQAVGELLRLAKPAEPPAQIKPAEPAEPAKAPAKTEPAEERRAPEEAAPQPGDGQPEAPASPRDLRPESPLARPRAVAPDGD